jgi:hypothetical protein
MTKKLPPNPLVTEVFQKISNAKTKAEKVALLQEYRSPALIHLFVWNFDESIETALPPGEVPYTPNDNKTGEGVSRLNSQYRILYNFVRGGNDPLSQTKRESMFIQLLESLDPNEAECLCLVKDKKLGKRYTITHNTVKEAYPDVVWGTRG